MMEVYFYCSYEHSQKGFSLTRLQGGELVSMAFDELPKVAEQFFSIDHFLLLWRDLTAESSDWMKPEVTGSFFGLRGLRGQMSDGRSSTVNLAFYADGEELPLLRRTALTILGDYDGFRARVFSWLSVGGPCSYLLDGDAFEQWLRQSSQANKLRRLAPEDDPAVQLLPLLQRQQPPALESELLRLAVCTCGWKEIRETMGHRLVWFLKPRNVLTPEAFDAAFTHRGTLWELTFAQ